MPPASCPAYLKWIRTLDCCVCGGSPSEAAHTGERGLGQKGSDYEAIPLCTPCHRLYHANTTAFYLRWNRDRMAFCAGLRLRFVRKFPRYRTSSAREALNLKTTREADL